MPPHSIELDSYIVDVLMRDLVGHERRPAAFVVYLYLAARVEGEQTPGVAASLGTIAAATGLSKTAVQTALALLRRRELISTTKTTATAIPVYGLKRHWRRRLRGN